MPSSNLACAPAVLAAVWPARPTRVLDVGPGRGKYGLLLKEYGGESLYVDAIEVEPSYLTHRLEAIYNTVLQGDVLNLSSWQLSNYDLVLMVDVIEHIEKNAALNLLDRIPGSIVICTPRDFFEQHVEGVPSEDHVSHWTAEDFANTGRLEFFDEALVDGLGAIVVRLGPR